MRVPRRIAAAWAAIRRLAGGSSEFDLLARTFFARFFENDITGGSHDLRNSFFWLIAFLAAPGALIPVAMSFNWDGAALSEGTEFLRIASRADKVLYLGFAMIASGFIGAITWSSLLLDRRDALVLGTLPISGRRIVRAKLTALLVYVVVVAIGTHAAASISYGFFLGTHNTFAFAWAGVVAHMIASCSASAFVLLAVVALQGVCFAAVGPRRFATISPWLQGALAALLLAGLMALPFISTATVDTLGGLVRPHLGIVRAEPTLEAHPWILKTPPLWFLGLYEVVLQTDNPDVIHLRMVALTALSIAGVLTLVTYPVAYRRLVSSVVEMSAPAPRHGWLGSAIERMVSSVSRGSVTRAASQFFLTTVRRSNQHRLAVAVAIGITLAAISPTLFHWTARLHELPGAPTLDLLAVPLEVILIMLVGLRIAAALPADLESGWMITGVGASTSSMRSGLWRTLFVAVVLPVSLLTLGAYWRVWGNRWALMHATICVVLGGVLLEMLLWGFEGMPCSRPWRPEHANVRKWWPAYLALFLMVTAGVPWFEQLCYEELVGFSAFIGSLIAIGIVLRITHHRRRIMPVEDIDEPTAVQVLNLD